MKYFGSKERVVKLVSESRWMYIPEGTTHYGGANLEKILKREGWKEMSQKEVDEYLIGLI